MYGLFNLTNIDSLTISKEDEGILLVIEGQNDRIGIMITEELFNTIKKYKIEKEGNKNDDNK